MAAVCGCTRTWAACSYKLALLPASGYSIARMAPAVLLGKFFDRLKRVPSFLWHLEGRFKGVEYGRNIDLVGRPIISRAENSRLSVGDGAKINSLVRANPLALTRPTVLRTLVAGAELRLDKGVGVSGAAICAGSKIIIGEYTFIGAGVLIMDNDFHHPIGDWQWATDSSIGARPIIIGRGVFIGANAIILKGVTIGDRAMIGAGAVVTRDVPAFHTAVGNPAKVFPNKEDLMKPQINTDKHG
jgi:acetyltransferase-like isoleucine patch superfamily enzyme